MSDHCIADGCVGQTGQHRDLNGSHNITRSCAKHGEAKHAVAFGIDEHLHESARFRDRHGTKHRSHGQPGQAIRDAALPGLRLAQADAPQLRIGKHAERNLSVRGHATAAGDVVTDDEEIVDGDVQGAGVAAVAEFAISFVLMFAVLITSNHPRLTRATPFVAAALVAIFITFEAPLSGTSMNPARTFGSSVVGQIWTALWVYFTAPVLAMQCAAIIYRRSGRVVYCAKLHHHNSARCIFNCAFAELAARELGARANSSENAASKLPPHRIGCR